MNPLENNLNLSLKNNIIDRQIAFITEKVKKEAGEATTKEELDILIQDHISMYYSTLGTPLTIVREQEEGHLPFLEEYNETAREMTEDVHILNDEINNIGKYMSDYFNYAQTEKNTLEKRIRGIGGLVSDLVLVGNKETANSIYIRDSFNDTTKVDVTKTLEKGKVAHIHTLEGVATLSRTEAINRSKNAKIRTVEGNGSAGTEHLARRTSENTDQKKVPYEFIAEFTPNNDPAAILDGRPDTIFEYQMVNTDKEFIVNSAKGYDFEWVSGQKEGDKLRLRMVIELTEETTINWITLNPYYAIFSTNKVAVHSIRTSTDGLSYESIYDGNLILNKELNTTPQTYREDAILDSTNDLNEAKFTGQGVFAFPTRKAKYVEIVLDQIESYDELIGHTFFKEIVTIKDSDGKETKKETIIPKRKVPESIVNGQYGSYQVSQGVTISKSVMANKGWRYAIGIRDVNIMSYSFVDSSELLSVPYSTEKEISKIMLYTNEKIPTSYLTEISKSNDWITYFISIDDINWLPISPMHHAPVALDGKMPPKIYEFNGTSSDLETSFQLNRKMIKTDKEVKQVRLKAVLKRPTNNESFIYTTPILEDYSIRVVFKEEV